MLAAVPPFLFHPTCMRACRNDQIISSRRCGREKGFFRESKSTSFFPKLFSTTLAASSLCFFLKKALGLRVSYAVERCVRFFLSNICHFSWHLGRSRVCLKDSRDGKRPSNSISRCTRKDIGELLFCVHGWLGQICGGWKKSYFVKKRFFKKYIIKELFLEDFLRIHANYLAIGLLEFKLEMQKEQKRFLIKLDHVSEKYEHKGQKKKPDRADALWSHKKTPCK